MSSNSVSSDLGVQILLGLVGPLTSATVQADLAAATGCSVDEMHADARRILALYYTAPQARLRAGFWTGDPGLVTTGRRALDGLLHPIASGPTGMAGLNEWVTRNTLGMMTRSPVPPPFPGGMIGMTVVATDDAWERPAAAGTIRVGPVTLPSFEQHHPLAAAHQVGDTLIVTSSLSRGLLVRYAIHPDTVDTAEAALTRLDTATAADLTHPLLRERRIAHQPDHPVLVTAIPAMTLRHTWTPSTDPDRWGIRGLFGPHPFPGLAGVDLPVDDITQTTFADLSHAGFRAASVTYLSIGAAPPRAATTTVPLLVFDRPFAFAVDDPATGLRLFTGRIGDLTSDDAVAAAQQAGGGR